MHLPPRILYADAYLTHPRTFRSLHGFQRKQILRGSAIRERRNSPSSSSEHSAVLLLHEQAAALSEDCFHFSNVTAVIFMPVVRLKLYTAHHSREMREDNDFPTAG